MDETEGSGWLYGGLFVGIVAAIVAVAGAPLVGAMVFGVGAVLVGVGLVVRGGVKRRIREERLRLAGWHHEQQLLRESEHQKALELAAAGAPRVERTVEKETHLVERQVVVMRCRYCSKLTPVDLKACEGCGHQL